MKNTIPLVVAVILGLLAVFAVSRTLSKNGSSQYGKEIVVLVANGNLKSGAILSAENFREREVPLQHAPKQHILGDQSASIIGQVISRDIVSGDYIQWGDIGQASSLGESVGEGEWAVAVTFANGSLVKMLKPGDEIAVVGTFRVSEEVETGSADQDKATKTVERDVTTVLFPQVRIMGMAGSGGVLLSLPPEQALTVIAAEEQAGSLYAVLRRPHDEKATNRKDCGQFDGSAFTKMLSGCKEIVIPDQPFNKVK